MRLARRSMWIVLAVAAACGPTTEEEQDIVDVAVAANFAEVQAALATRFEQRTGGRVRAIVGSTGQLYAQVRSGAPFDVLLAADDTRPRRLEEQGLAIRGSRFTYAEGRLALFAPGLDSVRGGGADLRVAHSAHVAIANPRIAPYGAAAMEVLERLGVTDRVGARLVRGENIGQAYQYVKSGAAEMGIVALAQVIGEPRATYWIVPQSLHAPIVQDAVLLRPGADNTAARAYLRFLRSAEARRLIESAGYAAGQDD